MDWNLVGFVKASKYRTNVLLALKNGNKTPSELKKKTNLLMPHISHTLKELKEIKLVECLTPKLLKGKLYSITQLGIDVVENI